MNADRLALHCYRRCVHVPVAVGGAYRYTCFPTKRTVWTRGCSHLSGLFVLLPVMIPAVLLVWREPTSSGDALHKRFLIGDGGLLVVLRCVGTSVGDSAGVPLFVD